MTVHTGRHFLQIPGPTNVPDRVLRAMDMPTMDHRGPEFAEIGHAVLAAMQRVFRTKQPVIIYPSSGTGAWEAALVNTLQPGDKSFTVMREGREVLSRPTPEDPADGRAWGGMLAESRQYVFTAPWLLYAPAAAVVLAVLTANLLGDGLAQLWDGPGRTE